MRYIAHVTDIHLDHVARADDVAEEALAAVHPSAAVVLTGDIATGTTFGERLREYARGAGGRRIYFVLGNHDAYYSSIAASRAEAALLTADHPELVYLPAAGVVSLSEDVALVGVDGFYDGVAGLAETSHVTLNDWLFVAELSALHRTRRLEVLGDLARADTAAAEALIRAALATHRHVIFATHVPPFHAASMDREGRRHDPAWAPWYVNLTMGAMLARLALGVAAPGQTITVLCGHAHGGADVSIVTNLRVICGPAQYGKSTPARVLDLAKLT